MAAIAAILVAPFWKKFRGFAVLLTWLAIFATLVQRGSSTQQGEINALSALFNISFSTAILIIFVILTFWIFSRLLRKKVIPTPKVS
jgi:Na+/phosphate symporter